MNVLRQSEKVKILVCSGNLGNKQPDVTSLNAWIPKDGKICDVLDKQAYPLGNSKSNSNDKQESRSSVMDDGDDSMTFADLEKLAAKGVPENFDIIVIGMQEAMFEIEERADPKNVRNLLSQNRMPSSRMNLFSSSQKCVTGLTTSKNHTSKAKKQRSSRNLLGGSEHSKNPLGGSEHSQSTNANSMDLSRRKKELPLPSTFREKRGDLLGGSSHHRKRFLSSTRDVGRTSSLPEAMNKMVRPTRHFSYENLRKNKRFGKVKLNHSGGTRSTQKNDSNGSFQSNKHDSSNSWQATPLDASGPRQRWSFLSTSTSKMSKGDSKTMTPDDFEILDEDSGFFSVPQEIGPDALEEKKGRSDTYVLHDLLQTQLPGYETAISYQQGQMRLLVFYDPEQVSLDVISIKAHNTGIGGLANKGGIVTEVNVNGTTRLAFFTAHLEAHEGEAKFQTRCTTIGDIFRATTSKVTKCRCDPSLSSHFMFAMGDLNFRTRLPNYELGSPEHIEAAHSMVVKKNWKKLYKHDELRRALKKKLCFAGFATPKCYFPPTFKVIRHARLGYSDKRSPSYTDRILYSTGHQLMHKLEVLSYEPCLHYTSSDHKPIRGAFEVELNPHLQATSAGPRSAHCQEKLRICVSALSVSIHKERAKYVDSSPSPFVVFVSTPEEALRNETPKWGKIRRRITRRRANRQNLKNGDGKGEWPKTSRKLNTFDPNWDDEEIFFDVKTHDWDGKPIDLSGAMIHLAVFDGKTSGRLVGVFSMNLASLIIDSRQKIEERNKSRGQPKARRSLTRSISGFFKRERKRILKGEKNMIQEKRLADAENTHNVRESEPQKDAFARTETEHSESSSIEIKALRNSFEDMDGSLTCNEEVTSGPSDDFVRRRSSGLSGSIRSSFRRNSFSERKSSFIGLGSSNRSNVSRQSGGLSGLIERFRMSRADLTSEMLHDMNIHSLRIDENLRKNGIEVGKIKITIDAWWLNEGSTQEASRKSHLFRKSAMGSAGF